MCLLRSILTVTVALCLALAPGLAAEQAPPLLAQVSPGSDAAATNPGSGAGRARGDRFEAGNRSYQSGDYLAAVAHYRALVREGRYAPELFFNLGNALYRAGEAGHAALWYQRALELDPGMTEARQNLTVIQRLHGSHRYEHDGLDASIATLSRSIWAWLAVVGAWSALLLAIAGFALPRLRPGLPGLLVGSAVCALLAITSAYGLHVWQSRLALPNQAVVVGKEIEARVSPVPDASPVVELPLGSTVRVIASRGPWAFVDIPGNLRGWVHRSAIETVMPLATTQARTE